MMKVLFIHPPWAEVYGSYRSAAKTGNAYPPLGICYLSAVMKQNGAETALVDAEMEGKSIDDCIKAATDFKPDYICLTSTSSIFHITKKLAEKLKENLDCPVIAGGAHITVMPEKAMEEASSIDYGISGEGEKALPELIDALENGTENLSSIKGLIYRDEKGSIRINEKRELIEDLDSLPFPDRASLQLDKYEWSVPGKGLVRFTTIMTSRGCPFDCIFCSAHTVFGKKVRYRKIEKVLDELEHLVNDFGIKHFALIDDTLTLKHDRVRELCAGIKERKLDISWEGWTRANTVDREILATMKDAGLSRISFGIESGNPEILKTIKKAVPLEAYPKAYKAASSLGLETRGSVILGHPYETRKSAMQTLNFIKKLRGCKQMYININTPYPGTKLYEMARQGEGGLKLLTNDLSLYRRYGSAVVEVNDLSAEDLVKLQKKGFRMFYFTPERIIYNLKRAGLKAAIKNAWAFFKSVILPHQKERQRETSVFHDAKTKMTGINIFNAEEYCRKRFDAVEKFLRGKEQILDAGCGEGFIIKYFGKKGIKMAGLDLNFTSLKKASLINKKTTLLNSGIENMPFADESFGAVFVNAVLHHTKSVRHCMEELTRILVSGGTLIMIEPNPLNPLIALQAISKASEWNTLRRTRKKLIRQIKTNENLAIIDQGSFCEIFYPYRKVPGSFMKSFFISVQGLLKKICFHTHYMLVCQKK